MHIGGITHPYIIVHVKNQPVVHTGCVGIVRGIQFIGRGEHNGLGQDIGDPVVQKMVVQMVHGIKAGQDVIYLVSSPIAVIVANIIANFLLDPDHVIIFFKKAFPYGTEEVAGCNFIVQGLCRIAKEQGGQQVVGYLALVFSGQPVELRIGELLHPVACVRHFRLVIVKTSVHQVIFLIGVDIIYAAGCIHEHIPVQQQVNGRKNNEALTCIRQ